MSTKHPICAICGRAVKATDASLYEARADGTRSHRHVACLRKQAEQSPLIEDIPPTPVEIEEIPEP